MRLLLVWSLVALPLPSAAIDIEWVEIGAPGNACDPQPQSCFGAVPFEFEISRYEVTNAQYAEFLNAEATVSSAGLYDPLNSPHPRFGGGIVRTGEPGNYRFDPVESVRSLPVAHIHPAAAAAFASWLSGEQPVEGTVVSLPTEDEWYKAAYYDPGSDTYFDYPTGSDEEPVCSPPSAQPNLANCNFAFGPFAPAGSYSGSPSPFGTFDQGGNAWE